MHPSIEPILTELKAGLQALYGDGLAQVILYGSYARGDFHDESDIDVLVVLRADKISSYGEIKRMSPFVTDLDIRYGVLISILPVTERYFETSWMPVYAEIRKEGVRL